MPKLKFIDRIESSVVLLIISLSIKFNLNIAYKKLKETVDRFFTFPIAADISYVPLS